MESLEEFTKGLLHEYTQIEDIWQCNDCGAHANEIKDILHFASCVTGECIYWEKFYEEEENAQD